MEEQIKEILMDTFEYCDCDICSHSQDVEDLEEEYCQGCEHKYCNWQLSEKITKNVSHAILSSIINRLREYIVDELMKDTKI